MSADRISYLIQSYAANRATDEEVEELFEWLRTNEDGDALESQLVQMAASTPPRENYNPEYWEPFIQKVMDTKVGRVKVVKWWRYAAAAVIVLCLGLGVYLWTAKKDKGTTIAKENKLQPSNDAAPGKNGAVLTLADGRQIILDNLDNGIVTTEGKTTVKIEDGQLVYDATKQSEVLYNTMTTPKGRQYQLVLPDGSKVWLNAASSIRYPTVFSGKERVVEITGEAYFEVNPGPLPASPQGGGVRKIPFIVKKGDVEVTVLGTHFNVNAYDDEEEIKVTLLEGSVKVASPPMADRNDGSRESGVRSSNEVILKPRQQGRAANGELSIMNNIDVEQVMAWKNGLFNFNHANLKSVMQQLARWYDMDVKYEGKIPNRTFRGKVTRDLNLSQVLAVLEDVEVKFRIEGKTLVVNGE